MENGILWRIEEAISDLNRVLRNVSDGDTSEIQKRLGHLRDARQAILNGDSEQIVIEHVHLALGFIAD